MGEKRCKKNVKWWIILGVVSFVIGFVIAQLFRPAVPIKTMQQSRNLLGSGEMEEAQSIDAMKKPSSYSYIIIAMVLLLAVVIYAYIREKRRKRKVDNGVSL